MEVQNTQKTSIYQLRHIPFKEVHIPLLDSIGAIASALAAPFRILFSAQPQKPVPPGTHGHFILGNYPELQERKFDLIQFFSDYYEKYGKEEGICKVALGARVFHIVTNPALLKEIFKNSTSFPRGKSLKIWQKFSEGGLSEGKKTMEYRHKALKAIGEESISYYFSQMKTVSGEWLKRLIQHYSTESFDLFYEAKRAGLAIMGQALFTNESSSIEDNPFGLEEKADAQCNVFLNAFQSIFSIMAKRMTSALANAPYFGEWAYTKFFPDEEKTFEESKKNIKEILTPIFKAIFTSKIDENSHLHQLIEAFEIDVKDPNIDKLLDESLGFLQASFETSSTALGWILNHLAYDQDLQKRLRLELQKACKETPFNKIEDFKKVPLLSQTMEEILRLMPPFPFLVREVEKPADFKEYQVNKGDTFLISPYLIHRNDSSWDEPAAFNPERFETEKLSDGWQKNKSNLYTFLAGPHRCAGRHFGKQELLILISEFLLKYTISHESPITEIAPSFSLTLQPKNPIFVKIKPINL